MRARDMTTTLVPSNLRKKLRDAGLDEDAVRAPKPNYKLRLADPHVIARADYWWERCMVRILHSGNRARILRNLVKAA
jgi:hypothetical protein